MKKPSAMEKILYHAGAVPGCLFRRGLPSLRVFLVFLLYTVVSSAQRSPFEQSQDRCRAVSKLAPDPDPSSRHANPRWNAVRGQNKTIILRNATLFDGEKTLPQPVDIMYSKGLIVSVAETASKSVKADDAAEFQLHGRFVTPGLVDMHSHHSISPWPSLPASDDVNEMGLGTPLTPFLRGLDGMKAYDVATRLIMSGGVTSSMIIPGSSNILAGEGTVIKNALKSGDLGEYVMEEMLLEHGVPVDERHRYIKVASGENPKNIYNHSRSGNYWLLRQHLSKARDAMAKQDAYCARLSRAAGDAAQEGQFIAEAGSFPHEWEFESTIGMLRGRVAMHNHCYEPQDFEVMLNISHEYGFRIRAFHHAVSAWEVPKMLKAYGDDLTLALWADFSMSKWEAYFPNLSAGKVLSDHGIPVAYKSDHTGAQLNAKYLMSQAAIGYSFNLPEDKALQAVTSIPAKAIDLSFRIGYARVGYDADVVVWDSHPLYIGATPLQVYVDGVPQLDMSEVQVSMGTNFTDGSSTAFPRAPQIRPPLEQQARVDFCRQSSKGQNFIIRGIKKAFLDNYPQLKSSTVGAGTGVLVMVIDNGSISCLGIEKSCEAAASQVEGNPDIVKVDLSNGYLLPGLTGLTNGLGMQEIIQDATTGDGSAEAKLDSSDPDGLDYAKYGVFLQGKSFARARMGGVTRAISPPAGASGLMNGVSVGILTRGDKKLLSGGIFQNDVALHVTIDSGARSSESTVSNAVKKLRNIIASGKTRNIGTIFEQVADGKFPLVVKSSNRYDIEQLIWIKKDFPTVNLVLMGGAESPFVAKELADSKIPVILTQARPAPSDFRSKEAFVGPPLTRSVASYLSAAGVSYGIALGADVIPSDETIHGLAREAAWVAKFAGLSDFEAVRLVSTNIETILSLKKTKDIVVWEGSPLEYGSAVVLSFQADEATGKMEVATCWPQEDGGHEDLSKDLSDFLAQEKQ